jgi:hypothetical protein
MPRHGRKYGHPIVISAELRDELSRAETTREVVYRIPERIRVLQVDTNAIYEDFDTPETYRKCVRKFQAPVDPSSCCDMSGPKKTPGHSGAWHSFRSRSILQR